MTKIDELMKLAFAYRMSDTVNLADTERDLMQALEAALKPGEPVVRWDSDGWGDLLVPDLPDGTLLYTAPPAQTPSQFGSPEMQALILERLCKAPTAQTPSYDHLYAAWIAVGADVAGLKWENFMKHLPAQTPPRLTDDEIDAIDADPLNDTMKQTYRAIETAVRRSLGIND